MEQGCRTEWCCDPVLQEYVRWVVWLAAETGQIVNELGMRATEAAIN